MVGNSHAVVDFYRKAGVPDDRLAMIHSGIGDEEPPAVDPADGPRASSAAPADAPLVLFAGRLAAQKGVDDLLAALDLLQHVRPDLRTLIVGDGPAARAARRDRATPSGSTARSGSSATATTSPGCSPRADLLVLPSLYEGLPNVVLEAMRFRKPVVATAAPGTTEVVVDGETGLLVPMQAATALAQAIRTVDRGPRPGPPPGRGRPGARRGRVPRRDDDRAVRRPLRAAGAGEGAEDARAPELGWERGGRFSSRAGVPARLQRNRGSAAAPVASESPVSRGDRGPAIVLPDGSGARGTCPERFELGSFRRIARPTGRRARPEAGVRSGPNKIDNPL